ncbi:MAG: hypothetical protein A4E63_02941 [Syntrophorhabdus sp. PtaU1.Bin050]|nr:MAG: hypothetical protein A4E63_02941 [Syntrophorhabdus sp. PtaU1.Bin050]
MKTRGMLVGILVMLSIVFMSFSSADATCYQYGKIQYISSPVATGTVYVYMAPSTSSVPYVYYYYTMPASYAYTAGLTTLNGAMAANNTVAIYGSATSCPTTGTYRYGGVITGTVYVWR